MTDIYIMEVLLWAVFNPSVKNIFHVYFLVSVFRVWGETKRVKLLTAKAKPDGKFIQFSFLNVP